MEFTHLKLFLGRSLHSVGILFLLVFSIIESTSNIAYILTILIFQELLNSFGKNHYVKFATCNWECN